MPQPLKATFQQVNQDGSLGPPLTVNYNPTEYTLSKGAQLAEIAIPGLDSPIIQFVRGQTETLSLDLFFDTTEAGMDDSAISVTTVTDQFYQMIKIDGTTHAPPICFFSWGSTFPGQRSYASMGLSAGTGSQQRYGFKCVVESVRQRYTLFNPQGVPLHAALCDADGHYDDRTYESSHRGGLAAMSGSGPAPEHDIESPTNSGGEPIRDAKRRQGPGAQTQRKQRC